MKTLLIMAIAVGFLANQVFGQADIAKKRAKELVNQNNVRQGIAPPVPPAAPRTSGASPSPASSPQQSIARLQADFAGFKFGVPATAAQKQQLTRNIALACRGTKPSLPTVTTFVNDLATALGDNTLDASKQARLAQDVDAVVNSGALPSEKFDALIADVQAVLQVGDAKRKQAAAAARSLRAVGLEVRKGVP